MFWSRSPPPRTGALVRKIQFKNATKNRICMGIGALSEVDGVLLEDARNIVLQLVT